MSLMQTENKWKKRYYCLKSNHVPMELTVYQMLELIMIIFCPTIKIHLLLILKYVSCTKGKPIMQFHYEI